MIGNLLFQSWLSELGVKLNIDWRDLDIRVAYNK